VASQKACAAQYAALNASSVYLLGASMLCSNVSATKTSSCQVKPPKYLSAANLQRGILTLNSLLFFSVVKQEIAIFGVSPGKWLVEINKT
jgi:hypothetical protein